MQMRKPYLERVGNCLLLTDHLWLTRLAGEGDHPVHEDRLELVRARIAEDKSKNTMKKR